MAELWDQQPDESRDRYIWFLTFRNLGPCRTVTRAYRTYLKEFELSESVPTRASGSWQEASREFEWHKRAEAWDLWRIVNYGARVAVLYTSAVAMIAEKLARAAEKYQVGTKEWASVLETLDRVSDQLSAARKAGVLGLETTAGPIHVGTDTPPIKPRILATTDPVE